MGSAGTIPRDQWSFVPDKGGGMPQDGAKGCRSRRVVLRLLTSRAILRSLASAWRGSVTYSPLSGVQSAGRRFGTGTNAEVFGISNPRALSRQCSCGGCRRRRRTSESLMVRSFTCAGAGKGGFDYRFAMPTRRASVLDGIYPTDFFPSPPLPRGIP